MHRQDSDSAAPEITMSVEASMPMESQALPESGAAMEGVESAVPEEEDPTQIDLEISDDEAKAKAKAKPRVVELNLEPPPNPIPLQKLQPNLPSIASGAPSVDTAAWLSTPGPTIQLTPEEGESSDPLVVSASEVISQPYIADPFVEDPLRALFAENRKVADRFRAQLEPPIQPGQSKVIAGPPKWVQNIDFSAPTIQIKPGGSDDPMSGVNPAGGQSSASAAAASSSSSGVFGAFGQDIGTWIAPKPARVPPRPDVIPETAEEADFGELGLEDGTGSNGGLNTVDQSLNRIPLFRPIMSWIMKWTRKTSSRIILRPSRIMVKPRRTGRSTQIPM